MTEGGTGLESEIFLQGGDIGVGHGDIAGLHGHELLVGFEIVIGWKHTGTHEFFLQDLYEIEEVLGLVITYIIYFIGGNGQTVLSHLFLGGMLHDAGNAFYNIVHIGEIALAMAVIENLDGLAGHELVGKAEVGHIGTAGRAIDGEEAQAGTGDVVELGIGMGHELVALLGGGIERHGVVHLVVGAVRDLLVGAIHAAGAGINQVFHGGAAFVITVAAGFEDVEEAHQVTGNVGLGIGDAVAHTCLGCEVDHYLRTVLGKQGIDSGTVGNVALHKNKVGILRELRQAFFLDAHIVVVVHVVDAHYGHVLTLSQQFQGQIASDETGGTRHQDGLAFQRYIIVQHIISYRTFRKRNCGS